MGTSGFSKFISYSHGGNIYSGDIELDFSANLNPLGIPEAVRAAAIGADFSHYPDTECSRLTAAIANYENVFNKCIVCGNGAADLIYRIASVISPKRALLAVPTFSEYEKALCEQECEIEFYSLREDNNFAMDDGFIERITSDIDVLFLCNPNNPVGNTIGEKLLYDILTKCAETGTVAVVDECFLDFTKGVSAKKFLNPYVVILKAFTKICCMAGLRLGYGVFGDERLAAAVKFCGQPWSVSSPAQAAGEAAVGVLQDTDYLSITKDTVACEREFLSEKLRECGAFVYPSEANFILFKTCCGNLEDEMRRRGIAVRCCENYRGLSKMYYRIAVRTRSENERFAFALKEILK